MAGDEELLASYPMYFGVSCAFVAIDLMSRRRCLDVESSRRSRLGEMMLKGSAQLLGLLVERAQSREEARAIKLKKAELELDELKRRRTEDAKANEKVVAIFAAHEQRWIAERRSLRLQIQALVKELQIMKSKHEDAISNLEKRFEEDERVMLLKDEALEQEQKKRKEMEEKLQLAEEVAAEMTERAKQEAQDHSAELWKHKTAFVELVSSQRQMEAEMSRALRQAEAAKQELEEVLERKQEAAAMVDRLSREMVNMQKDSEQKDKILSAMLRKSKLDAAEKQRLLKEVKMSKAKKKQAELEMERWRNMWESRHKKSSRDLHSVEVGSSQIRRLESPLETSGHNPKNLLLDCFAAEGNKEHDSSTTTEDNIGTAAGCYDRYSSDEADEPGMDDLQRLQDWIRKETEKYATILEQKHYAEIDAFAEQMRQKDEKLEAFRWRVLSMELETKRLKSHIEGLDGNLFHLREENIRLEAMLLDKEREIKSLKEEVSFHVRNVERNSSSFLPCPEARLSRSLWSEVKITKKRPTEKDDQNDTEDTTVMRLGSRSEREVLLEESGSIDVDDTDSAESPSPTSNLQDHIDRTVSPSEDQANNISVTSGSANKEIEEEEVNLELGNSQESNGCRKGCAESAGVMKDTSWKMDIQALAISYKIKRLKQQLVVLEKLVGSQANKDDASSTSDGSNDEKRDELRQQLKGLLLLKSLLHKQLKRYQSLEEKTDDLCRRMHENYRSGSRRELQNGRTNEQTVTLRRFLEETFQLQRYMVATGQKLMQMQSRIASTFTGAVMLDETVKFNMGQFADIVRTLFREIQRGLEVRIARVIGDLEGTLACDGILRRWSCGDVV
ncbi:hypothetical protein OPV22_012911 [Ensete ventricosum]|uniref:Uncharacterized protein n=1 Tax=Ensete ventricosum TaxID=4639 RepID=A0AAV8QY58_ENSVE|nr:hypothetical protein OPV22_012911 [Ensete ventricosum]